MADARKLEAQLEPVPSPQLQDESADPRLREPIYRAGTVIRLRVEDSDWVWDVFIRAQDDDETRLGGLPIKPGELYPLLVMENLGRGASRFLVVSMCARACAAGATVTTERTDLFNELQAVIADVTSNGVVEADIKCGLDKKLARKLEICPPGAIEAPAEPPRRSPRKQLSTTRLPTDLPQHTFPEAKAAAIALADGPKLRRWLPVEGEVALRHRVSEREPLQTKLLGAPLLDWLGMPSTLEGLQNELRQLGLPAVLLLHVCLGAARGGAAAHHRRWRSPLLGCRARPGLIAQELGIPVAGFGARAPGTCAMWRSFGVRCRQPAAKLGRV